MNLFPVGIPFLLRWTRRRLFVHYPRLVGWWLIGKRQPEVILIELTNACNQGCPFCAREVMSRDVGFMPFEVFTSIVDQAAAFPYALIRLMGLGEASLHPRFRDCIKYATERNLEIEITSNGHIFEVLSPDEIMESSIIMLSISIDGFGDGSYEKMRTGGDYHALRENVHAFHNARKSKKSKRPLFTLRSVLFGKTPEKRAQYAQRFSDEWAGLYDRVSFNDYIPLKLTEKNAGNLRVCDDILYNLHIDWDGRTPLCSYQHQIVEPEYTGNAGVVPLTQIWNEERRTEMRKAHVCADLSVAPFCQNCPKTRKAAVYRNVRDNVRHNSSIRQAAERLLWRIVS